MNNSSSQQAHENIDGNKISSDYNNVYYYSTLIPKNNKIAGDLFKNGKNPRTCLIGFERKCKCLIWTSIPDEKSLAEYFLIEILIDKKNGGNFIICQFMVDHFFKHLKLTNNVTLNRISYVLHTSFFELNDKKRLGQASLGRVYRVHYVREILQRNLRIKQIDSFETVTTFKDFPQSIQTYGDNSDDNNMEFYDEQVFKHLKKHAKTIIGSIKNKGVFSPVPVNYSKIEIGNRNTLLFESLPPHFHQVQKEQDNIATILKRMKPNIEKKQNIKNGRKCGKKKEKEIKGLLISNGYISSFSDKKQKVFLPNYNNSEGLNQAIEVEESDQLIAVTSKDGSVDELRKLSASNKAASNVSDKVDTLRVENAELVTSMIRKSELEPIISNQASQGESKMTFETKQSSGSLDQIAKSVSINRREVEVDFMAENAKLPENSSKHDLKEDEIKSDLANEPNIEKASSNFICNLENDLTSVDVELIIENARSLACSITKQASILEVLKSISLSNPKLEKTVSNIRSSIDKNEVALLEMSQFLLTAGMPETEVEQRVLNCLLNSAPTNARDDTNLNLVKTISDRKVPSHKSEVISTADNEVMPHDSYFYRTVGVKYSECVKSLSRKGANQDFTEIKKKQYSMLEELTRETRAKKFCRGSDKYSYGYCLDDIHTGSALEKLISESFIQNNLNETRASSNEVSLKKMVSEIQKLPSEEKEVVVRDILEANSLTSKANSVRNSQEVPVVEVVSKKSESQKLSKKKQGTVDSLDMIDGNVLSERRKTLSGNELNDEVIDENVMSVERKMVSGHDGIKGSVKSDERRTLSGNDFYPPMDGIVIVKSDDILLRTQRDSINGRNQEPEKNEEIRSFDTQKNVGLSGVDLTCYKKKHYEILQELLRLEKIKNMNKGCLSPGHQIDPVYTGSPLERMINECIIQSNNDNIFEDFQSENVADSYQSQHYDDCVENAIFSVNGENLHQNVCSNRDKNDVYYSENTRMTCEQDFGYPCGDQVTCFANDDQILPIIIDEVAPNQHRKTWMIKTDNSSVLKDLTNTTQVCKNSFLMNDLAKCSAKTGPITSEVRCEKKFKNSLFYKSVVEKYANFMKDQKHSSDENSGLRFKDRDYRNLQKLVKLQKSRHFCKGMSERKLGFCMNQVYKGCFLEKLIADNPFLYNLGKNLKRNRLKNLLIKNPRWFSNEGSRNSCATQIFSKETRFVDNNDEINRSQPDFENTTLYQSVVTNYALCLDKEDDYDSDLTGNRYKNRDFESLRGIVHKHRMLSLFKGIDWRRLGMFVGGNYRGSALERLIYKSFIRHQTVEELPLKRNSIEESFITTENKEVVNQSRHYCYPRNVIQIASQKLDKTNELIFTMRDYKRSGIISSGDNDRVRRKFVFKREKNVYQYMNAIDVRSCSTPVDSSFEEWTIYDTLPNISQNVTHQQLFRENHQSSCLMMRQPDQLICNPSSTEVVYLAEVYNRDLDNQYDLYKLVKKGSNKNFKNESYSNKFGSSRFVFDFTKTAKDKMIKLDLLHSWKENKNIPNCNDNIEITKVKDNTDAITISFIDGDSNADIENSSENSQGVSRMNVSFEEESNALHGTDKDNILRFSYKTARDIAFENDFARLKVTYDKTSVDTSKVFEASSNTTTPEENIIHVLVTIDECFNDSGTEITDVAQCNPYDKYLIRIDETPARTENESEVYVITEQSAQGENLSESTITVETNRQLILSSCSTTLSSDERVRNILIESLAIKELELNRRLLSINRSSNNASKNTLSDIESTNQNSTNGEQMDDKVIDTPSKGWASHFDIVLRQIMFKSQLAS